MKQTVIRAGIVLAVIYSIISGIWFPLRNPTVGQIVEELQPLYRLFTVGQATVVLAGCMLYGTRAAWIEFAIAVLLVGNILPRGLFARAVLIDPLMTWTGYTHLTRSEAYQYFCFPLLGLLVLLKCWARVSTEGAAERGVAV